MNRYDIIPIAAISVGVVLGAMRWLQPVPVVLPVDFGILLAARTEAQRTADARALSGALSLWEAKNDVDRARVKAIEYANANIVHGGVNDVLIEDLERPGG